MKNEFELKVNEIVGEKRFHMNSFARRLVLIQRQKTSQKWPFGCHKS